ncbi:GNAT family N-acetyltransferase [Neolewinella lacunae]|uniref:GNAT family N-acetyltransferase n=1 Tax=Neolewinella lacunae TaxID=1517758 RepID=A0A923PK83_9BACT|nr:GNAT family N-acetyltransferase [Neolewinella lacunae]MBC6992824.1 GNAT family N-acetyltransferase [Neolewinella lacunae]MDN3636087.1 GNAT family N-acetyltransferase [Neolewinella lacunae]
MTLRPARLADFDHLETFVWQAIFPAFDHPGLTDAQREENDALIELARTEVVEALDLPHHAVFVAIDGKTRTLAGYVVVDASPRAYAEIKRLIVKRAHWGKGVGAELMEMATDFIGRDRAVSACIRYYNERALSFFAKQGFVDTGETTGAFAIPRKLLLREAFERLPKTAAPAAPAESPAADDYYDFPTEADEPVFESLPDYRLTTDDAPLFETGENALRAEEIPATPAEESSLTEDQLSVLEAFIARARAAKGLADKIPEPAAPSRPASPPASSRSDHSTPPSGPSPAHRMIEFEVDFGDKVETISRTPHPVEKPTERAAPSPNPVPATASFEFAFDSGTTPEGTPSTPTQSQPKPEESPKKTPPPQPKPANAAPAVSESVQTKHCPDCQTSLPISARFCFTCGFPQPEPSAGDTGDRAPEEDFLVLEEIPPVTEPTPQAQPKTPPPNKAEPAAATPRNNASTAQDSTEKMRNGAAPGNNPADLKTAFREYLSERVVAYFGQRHLTKYLDRLDSSIAFQQVRDGSLAKLSTWLGEQGNTAASRVRRRNILADLTEYFLAETAADLHGHLLPQRLLRHQSVDWEVADLFRLVMDYLDFASESERVYTDFVVMPTRALKNATTSFLRAARDERVFFICDQSLISQAKNGFAVTDSGIYWKNVLQPAGSATFTTMDPPRIEQGHLVLDGQYFDAGSRLNLKIAVLLDKLRRMG